MRHPDPALPGSKNRYAVALYDSYNPEVLFGEVLLIPEWVKKSPTKEEIRLNGGVPPPPEPALPQDFIIQLYNPDQQVHVQYHAGTWTSAPSWGFDIPQQSFRKPSTSSLDRTQDDPTASETTPKLGFKWKKDGKLSKDFVCSLSDKSTNPDGSKRKNREPDITVAIFKNYKEVTIYEPNLSRIDIEDPKGFEVVMILGAVVLREVFNSSIREAFNITDPSATAAATSDIAPQQPPRKHRHSASGIVSSQMANAPSANTAQQVVSSSQQPPPTDPRTQWELDAEEARLRRQVEHEERKRRRADAAETRRVKKMLEDEERRARERQKEVDRETERLKKIYGKEEKKSRQQMTSKPPPLPSRHSHQPAPQNFPPTAYAPDPYSRPHSAAPAPYVASNLRTQYAQQPAPFLSPYAAPNAYPDPAYVNLDAGSSSNQTAPPPKKSFWRPRGNDDSSRLTKQRSTVF